MTRSSKTWNNWLLLLGVVLLAVVPLGMQRGAEFGGADGEAEAAIQAVQPDYQPWLEPLLTPASGEVESLLFSLQAALGAGTIGFVVGLYRGRSENYRRKRASDGDESRD